MKNSKIHLLIDLFSSEIELYRNTKQFLIKDFIIDPMFGNRDCSLQYYLRNVFKKTYEF
jgi:hypothetical protein